MVEPLTNIPLNHLQRVAQFGSAGDLGSSGRRFESCHADQWVLSLPDCGLLATEAECSALKRITLQDSRTE